MSRRRRLVWAAYVAASAVAVSVCFVLVLDARGATSAGLILLAGLIVVGTGAAMTQVMMSSAPELEDGGRGARGGWEGASLDGGGDAGF